MRALPGPAVASAPVDPGVGRRLPSPDRGKAAVFPGGDCFEFSAHGGAARWHGIAYEMADVYRDRRD